MLRLKSIRILNRMSREFVCDELGINVFTYKSWEQGKYEPKIEILIKLSKLFNVSIDELVGNDRVEIKRLQPKLSVNEQFENIIKQLKDEIRNEIMLELQNKIEQ